MNQMSTDMEIQDILWKPKTIAVYGMSTNPDKPSHYVPLFLQSHGFQIIPVNPGAETIAGCTCHAHLDDIEQRIDILQVFRSSEQVPQVMEEALRRREKRGDIDVIWLQLGIRNEEARRMAEQAGIVFVQDKCMKMEYQRLQS